MNSLIDSARENSRAERMSSTARDIGQARIVVVGCGTSGIAAAVTAARLGLKVACVERSSLPGGLLTQTNHWINDFDNKGGFVSEVMDYLSKNKC